MEARPEENRMVKNFRRPGDPFVLQTHGGSSDARLAIAVRFQNISRHIYCYNHATRCVDQPCQSAVLWPVLWILARLHPRQIWCGKSLPNVDNFKASLNIFANRIRWRWLFRDTPRQQFSMCVPSHGKTRVCTHPVGFSLDTWISNSKRCPTEVFVKSSRTGAPVQPPVTHRCATKSLSSISVSRFRPRVVLKQLQMTKMVVTPLLILKC